MTLHLSKFKSRQRNKTTGASRQGSQTGKKGLTINWKKTECIVRGSVPDSSYKIGNLRIIQEGATIV